MWNTIEHYGPKYGYYPQASKTWIIVKPDHFKKAKEIFADTEIKITTKGKKHLGVVIGDAEYRESFMIDEINIWLADLTTLVKIAIIAPHEAYTCFTAGYKHKLNYYMRTIPNIGSHLKKVDDLITTLLIPSMTGGIFPKEIERRIFSLPPSMGGLGITIFREVSKKEFQNSNELTKSLQNDIVNQTSQSIKLIKTQLIRSTEK